jgi:hypothetical protein
MSIGSDVEPLKNISKMSSKKSSMSVSEYVEKMKFGGLHENYDDLSD